ncbi:TPA: hypothetical protein N3N84_002921 [Klebsiella variicola subsp. variicola]|nr:hypothetical protein [Klebsiella variicola subsp. variicola]
MEMIVAIIALVISGVGLVWGMSRDKKEDNSEIDDRLKDIEQKIPLFNSRVERLEADQSEMKQTLRNLKVVYMKWIRKLSECWVFLKRLINKNKGHMPLFSPIR